MDAETQAVMQSVLDRARDIEARRMGLPCHGLDEDAAVKACPYPNGECEFRRFPEVCPRQRRADLIDHAEYRLRTAGVGDADSRLIIDHVARKRTLRYTAALRAVQAWLAGKQYAPPTGTANGALRGGETLLALSGNPGQGKTVAGAYAIARMGGQYVEAYDAARYGYDVSSARRARLLVLDQLGREPTGASDWSRSNLEQTIVGRYADGRATLILCNLAPEDFKRRYEAAVADRVWGDRGAWLQLSGESLRRAP